MKKPDIKKGWGSFAHWKGWKTTATLCVKLWSNVVHWAGWKVIFGLPFGLLLVLSLGCAAGLIWVFIHNRMAWIPAYFLYALSAYSLTALSAKLPGAIRGRKQWLDRIRS